MKLFVYVLLKEVSNEKRGKTLLKINITKYNY